MPNSSSTAPSEASKPRGKGEPFRETQQGVAQLAALGKQPVVILDEADLMRSPLFDELRILLNYEMDSKEPLLMILPGQPQMLAKLALAAMYNAAARSNDIVELEYLLAPVKGVA